MPSHSRLISVIAVTTLSLALAITSAGCATQSRTKLRGQQRAGQHAAVTATRKRAQPPKPVWLQQLTMVTATAGWALAWSGNPNSTTVAVTLGLLRTDDGGRTWTSVTPPAARPLITPLNSYEVEYPRSASTAWFAVTQAAAESATTINRTRLFETTDAGRTWTASALIRAPGTVGPTGSLTFAGRSDGWLMLQIGEAMSQDQIAVYATTDAGRRWSLAARTLPPPTPGTNASGLPTNCDKTGISFATASTGFISAQCPLGLADTLLISTDGGRHWRPDPLPVPAGTCQQSQCDASSPQFFGQAGVITLGQYPAPGFLLTSHDAGASWQLRALPPGNDPYPQATFYDASTGTVIPTGPQQSRRGVFYLTRDGGLTWRFTRQGGSVRPSGAISFVSPERGFGWNLNGQPPAIYTTANGGRSWTRFIPVS
ncbi:MAG TPA: hypothetical protein VMR14_10380 [Streptosporangiaceae bacterium]|nr:hypothetical protein [Streptosporangiaceae bacterium]